MEVLQAAQEFISVGNELGLSQNVHEKKLMGDHVYSKYRYGLDGCLKSHQLAGEYHEEVIFFDNMHGDRR
jgi:hypothetical protein